MQTGFRLVPRLGATGKALKWAYPGVAPPDSDSAPLSRGPARDWRKVLGLLRVGPQSGWATGARGV